MNGGGLSCQSKLRKTGGESPLLFPHSPVTPDISAPTSQHSLSLCWHLPAIVIHSIILLSEPAGPAPAVAGRLWPRAEKCSALPSPAHIPSRRPGRAITRAGPAGRTTLTSGTCAATNAPPRAGRNARSRGQQASGCRDAHGTRGLSLVSQALLCRFRASISVRLMPTLV
jgi:hypothetical protein